MQRVAETFGDEPLLFQWNGGSGKLDRQKASVDLAGLIGRGALNVVGFSHGGNVALSAIRRLGAPQVQHLVTIGTPVLPDSPPCGVHHIHVYNPIDLIQKWGGESVLLPLIGTLGPAGRTFPAATNIAIEIAGHPRGRHGNLMWDARTWNSIRAEIERTRPRVFSEST
jgi:hypothetical protein